MQFQDFGRQVILDADGEAVPKSDFYVVTLGNGWSFAARGSGTEPKKKFYVFAQAPVGDLEALPSVKARVKTELERLKSLIDADARTVEIYRPDREPELLTGPESVTGEGPVEGFILNLRTVWDPLGA